MCRLLQVKSFICRGSEESYVALIALVGFALALLHIEVYGMFGESFVFYLCRRLEAHLVMARHTVLGHQISTPHSIVMARLTRLTIHVTHVAVLTRHVIGRRMVGQPVRWMRHHRLVAQLA